MADVPAPQANIEQLAALNQRLASSFRERANFLAARGVRVTPALPKTKRPFKDDWGGRNSSTSQDQILAWDTEDTEYNSFAVAADGFIFVDFDDPGLLSMLEGDTGEKLPPTLTVRGGKPAPCGHYYFRHTAYSRKFGNIEVSSSAVNGDNRRIRLIDWQAEGAKGVVGPGSLHPSGKRYRVDDDSEIPPVPDWLVDWVIAFKKRQDDFFAARGANVPILEVRKSRKNASSSEVAARILTRPQPYDTERDRALSQSMGFDHRHQADEKFAIWLVTKSGFSQDEVNEKFARHKLHQDRTDSYDSITLQKAQAFLSDDLEIPAHVDFSAPSAVETQMEQIPEDAMYGNAHRLASILRCPMSYAYPAVLSVIASHGFEDVSNVRPTLYVNLLGPVHSGKSVTRDRATRLLDIGDRLIDRTPASDRGLYRLFASTLQEDAGKSYLLSADEMRTLMSKGAIENSTLVSVLCELWSKNTAGGADKTTDHGVNLRLSLLGCTKIKDPSEFPDVFGFATAHGFYDRCIFGVRVPGEDWEFMPLDVKPVEFFPSKPVIYTDAFQQMHEWRKRSEDRDRLGELALRIAYLTSAANGDASVTDESMRAALRFMEWQEQIRTVYRPARGANEHQECVDAVIEAFERAPGKAAKWRDLVHKGNWYRQFPRSLRAVKRLLEDEGVIVYSKEHRKHFLARSSTSNKETKKC